ncbi:PQQ-dependent sugar dehydrogenase [Salinibacterium sp. G-O1]|uniref:PQQ-dependent sugar dehydrogenase n=1 Tax=Salinibacterium sp. G-O1 TaxID=3046208 RepID=UPI0024B9F3B7|nr:PQQ-dependent sugar dehydrogenase [Salinibacterium sp. G-O1]MDJ0334117.1 PQQ-dependent sugar dehydrogenase [Salinibacterium sp. G-O1]
MRIRSALTAAVVAVLLAGCATQAPGELTTPTPSTPAPTASAAAAAVQPVGETSVIASGLDAPWSMVRLDDGSTLISERDSRRVLELTADGTVREVGSVDGAAPGGEGGLLGIELAPGRSPGLFVYLTAADDNRIVRFDLVGATGSYALGESRDILTGIRKAGNHNGGRIKLGPDGKLYATVGDAGDRDSSQDSASLNGKILRMNIDGSVPDDNPFTGSLVYSLGHRNPQGLAWDGEGQLWAAEFGQNTWDEFNIIRPGANYGWPIVEGASDDPTFVNPVYQWATDDASPSGLTWVGGTFFMAGLGGERLWAINPGSPTTAMDFFADSFGRIRDVIPGPDGSLWMLTNNTDGRGSPRERDDRILQVELAPAS